MNPTFEDFFSRPVGLSVTGRLNFKRSAIFLLKNEHKDLNDLFCKDNFFFNLLVEEHAKSMIN